MKPSQTRTSSEADRGPAQPWIPTLFVLLTASALWAGPASAQTTAGNGNANGMGAGANNGGSASLRGLRDLPQPLAMKQIPLPPNLGDFVSDFDAAVRLGKAFFWDIQVGSDGMTACASCHWHAGADVRAKSQLSPGHDSAFQTLPTGQGGNNYTVKSGDFPFTERADPNDHDSSIVRDINDRLTSSGIQHRQFTGCSSGVGQEQGNVVVDPPFNLNGSNVGRVEPRNSPTVINAIFNVRSFWDGRADQTFNGVNIWGARDPNAKVLQKQPDGSLAWVNVLLEKAALASQAVGPALSDFEMSYAGKSLPELGMKMILARPLKDQYIDPTDVHFGSLSDYPNRGMRPEITYADLIRAAFHDKWHGGRQVINGHTHMENNFSLFWGLAILCYESQLVSDDAPFDRYAAGDLTAMTEEQIEGMKIYNTGGAACSACHAGSEFAGATWSQVAQEGVVERMATLGSVAHGIETFTTFPDLAQNMLSFDPRGAQISVVTPTGEVVAYGNIPGAPGNCVAEEFDATLIPGPAAPLPPVNSQLEAAFDVVVTVETFEGALPGGLCHVDLAVEMKWGNDPALPAGLYPILVNGQQIGVLTMGTAQPNGVYDVGFYNLGVRPTYEDIGGGAVGPFGPLSVVERLKAGDPHVQQWSPTPGVSAGETTITMGTFKTPSLRNISLTGPYFHNGGAATLEQVIQFYARGADFAELNAPNLDEDVDGVGSIRNKPAKQAALTAFLRDALLDERVAKRSGKFCTPSLPLKDGYLGNEFMVVDNGLGEAVPFINELPATGALGGAPFKSFADQLDGGVNVVHEPNLICSEEAVEGCGPLAVPSDSDREVRIYLTNQPQSDVTIDLSLSDRTELEITPTQLVFNTENWFHPQVIKVKGKRDGELDGTNTATIITSATISTDPKYSGLAVEDVTVTVTDATSWDNQIHVDASVSTQYPNGSQARPYPTIGQALSCAPAGSVIHVASGTYNENLLIQGKHLTIDGSNAIINGGQNGPVITVFGADTQGTILRGLTLINGGGQNAQAGALFVTDSTDVTVDGCVLRQSMGQMGGGVFVRNSSRLALIDSLVEDNTGTQQGGGLFVDGGALEVVNSVIRDNVTNGSGGGIFLQNAVDLVLDGVVIRNNAAGQQGGGLVLNGGQADISNVQVVFNSSSQSGGGIQAVNSVSLTAFGLKIANNTAQNGVGGLFMDGGLLDLSSTTIATNSGAQLFLMNSINTSLINSIVWGGGKGTAVASNLQNLLPGNVEYSIVDWNGFAATGYLTLNPMFMDALNGNHTPAAGSPALDGGDPSEQDPDGSRIDIGSHPIVGN